MRNISVVIVVIATVGLIVGGGSIAMSDDRPPIEQAPPVNETTPTAQETQVSTTAPKTYAVTAHSAEAINKTQLSQHGDIGTQAENRIEVTMSPSNVSSVENLSWVESVRPVIRPKSPDIPGSGDRSSLGVETLHQNGVTGSGVTVGIIDSGFDADNQAIASNVVDTTSFGDSQRGPAHGTSVAEVVTRVAPDTQLYLASADTDIDHERAIQYLTEQDVDIIVYSIGWPPVIEDGSHFLTDDINAATSSGTLFVSSAGNYAQNHWEGDFRDADDDGFLDWDENGDELNCIPNCNSDYSGQATVYIKWEDVGTSSQYRPLLYNPVAEEYIRVGSGRVFTTSDGNKYTTLSASSIPSQPVDLVIQHESGLADDEIEVLVVTAPSIERNVPSSSLSVPADVRPALAVAAYEPQTNRVAPYSSRGPTEDGRQGVDVTAYTNINVENGLYSPSAYTFAGTSAAAPYAGGVAALIEDRYAGDASPAMLTETLQSSSDDILEPGGDTVSGTGVVNAVDAVGSVRANTPTLTVAPMNTTVPPNGTATIDVVIKNTSDIGSYNFSATVNNTMALQIEAITPQGSPGASDTTISPDGREATTSAALADIDDTGDAVIGQTTIRAGSTEPSSGELTVSINELSDLDGNNYDLVDKSATATVSVETTPGDVTGNGEPAQDLNNDGVYEDVNGDGKFRASDVQALFAALDSIEGQSAFDFNGDGQVAASDVQTLFAQLS